MRLWQHRWFRILIAALLPGLAFFIISGPADGFLFFILQMTIVGWILAAYVAIFCVNFQYEIEKIANRGLSH